MDVKTAFHNRVIEEEVYVSNFKVLTYMGGSLMYAR